MPATTHDQLRRYLRSCLMIFALVTSGCNSQSAPTGGSAPTSDDPFAAALSEAEPEARPYLEASKPILAKIAARDWAGFYDTLSSHAKARMNSQQFVPVQDSSQPSPPGEIIENPTLDQFLGLIGRMEQTLQRPLGIIHVYVESTDPEVLAGRGEQIDVMLAIGGMPSDIPAEIRKAAVRAQVQCQLPDESIKQIATELNIPEEQVRAMKLPEDAPYDTDDWPYLNFKCVLVEEQGQLRVGYFEFLPPSILD